MSITGTLYTVLPAVELEKKLSNALAELSATLKTNPDFQNTEVVLGGGYGRGEGGVFHGNMLYNDLDFFVFTEHLNSEQQQKLNSQLAPIAEKMAQELKLDVDFAPARNFSTLKKVGNTLMFQELRNGHKVILGSGKFTQYLDNLSPDQIPWIEAVRLLLNRGMGLLFAGEHLADNYRDTNFILRNLNKAVLGCGDAKLIHHGAYCWRGNDRVKAVAQSPLTPKEPELYRQAWLFKIEPNDVIPEDLGDRWLEIRELWKNSVCQISNSSSDSTKEITQALHHSCKLHGNYSWTNPLKWAIKNRDFSWSTSSFDAPVARLLAELYSILAFAPPYPNRTAQLYRGWEKFN